MNKEDLDKLGLVSRELQRKDNLARLERPATQGGIVGGRPDGTMDRHGPVELVRNYISDARRIIDNFEQSTIQLESKVAQLEAQIDMERAARKELEKMITEIAKLVSPQ
jgi:hypothetical protein